MRYDKAPRPLSALTTVPPRRVKLEPGQGTAVAQVGVAQTEQVIFGQVAVWDALQRQTDQLLQLLYAPEQIGALAPVLPILVALKVVCRQADAETLARVAGSAAHQGLVARIRAVAQVGNPTDHWATLAQTPGCSLLLTGAISAKSLADLARTAAYFGVQTLWLDATARSSLNALGIKAALGGLQGLALNDCAAPLSQLATFVRAGGTAVALSREGQHGLQALAGLGKRAILLALNAEDTVLDPSILAAMSLRVRIDANGSAPSLPASVLAGIALAMLQAAPAAKLGVGPIVR